MQVNANEINHEVMGLVIETAQAALEASASIYKDAWLRAVSKAADEFLLNPYFSYEDGVLIINSQQSQTIYEVKADGSHVGCPANELHKPCYHRAMRRLLDIYKAAMALAHVPRPDLEPQRAVVAAETRTAEKAQPQSAPTFPHYRRPASNPDSPAKRALDAVKAPAETAARPYPEGALIAPSLLQKPDLYDGIEY